MSRNHARCGACRAAEAARLPPGAGLAIAGTAGLGSLLLGIAVWLSGTGLGWAIATWLIAPLCCAFVIAAVPALTTPAPSPHPGTPTPCRARDGGGYPRRHVNV